MTPTQLRLWRKQTRMTQAEAAGWVGISRRLWIRFEVGDRPIPKWLDIIAAMTPFGEMPGR